MLQLAAALVVVATSVAPAHAAAHGFDTRAAQDVRPTEPAVATLPTPVAQALARARIPLTAVSVLVQASDAPQPRLALNADNPRNPASLIKLYTTLAALEILGPAHTWRSELLSEGVPERGVLRADLYLRGNGEPLFTQERLWLLLRQLRDAGVRDIAGDVRFDRSAFAPEVVDPGTFDAQPLRPYNAQPDALLFNFNALTLHLVSDPASATVRVSVQPAPDNVQVDNRLRSGGGLCGEWRERLRAVPEKRDGHWQLRLDGEFPLACGERDWHISALPADDLLAGSWRALWRELGGSVRGQLRSGITPPAAQVLATLPGTTLAAAVAASNKFSNNVLARQIFLSLGREVRQREAMAAASEPAANSVAAISLMAPVTTPAGTPPTAPPPGATEADARAAVYAWLARNDIAARSVVLGNGAGLSRDARASAAELAALLRHGWRSRAMPEFIASLPLLGSDGTLRKRLVDSPLAGRAHLKTGSLDGVKAMAGYVSDSTGRRSIVVFLVNHPQAALAQDAMDALLIWLGDNPA